MYICIDYFITDKVQHTRMDDFIELLIYIAIGVVGLIATAYRNKQKRQAQPRRAPRETVAEPMQDVQPDFGPLAEIFGIPEMANPKPVYIRETEEQSIEEDGSGVEEEGFSVDKASIETEQQSSIIEKEGLDAEKFTLEGIPVFDITKATLISDSISDNAINDYERMYEPISASEIKGISDFEKPIDNEAIDWRKAVIYSEILKRREN